MVVCVNLLVRVRVRTRGLLALLRISSIIIWWWWVWIGSLSRARPSAPALEEEAEVEEEEMSGCCLLTYLPKRLYCKNDCMVVPIGLGNRPRATTRSWRNR